MHATARSAIAPVLLLPGDPLRVRWAAEHCLEAPRPLDEPEAGAGYAGHWRGQPVSIRAGAAPGLLRRQAGGTVIRIGTAAALQPELEPGDLVIASAASGPATPEGGLFHAINFAPPADFALLEAAVAGARRRGLVPHVGGVFSAGPCPEERPDLLELMARHGALAVEAGTAALYAEAARHGARVLSLLTVTEQLARQEAATRPLAPAGRALIELALEAALAGRAQSA